MKIDDGESFIGLCGMIGAIALPAYFYFSSFRNRYREKVTKAEWFSAAVMGMCFGGLVGIILLIVFNK